MTGYIPSGLCHYLLLRVPGEWFPTHPPDSFLESSLDPPQSAGCLTSCLLFPTSFHWPLLFYWQVNLSTYGTKDYLYKCLELQCFGTWVGGPSKSKCKLLYLVPPAATKEAQCLLGLVRQHIPPLSVTLSCTPNDLESCWLWLKPGTGEGSSIGPGCCTGCSTTQTVWSNGLHGTWGVYGMWRGCLEFLSGSHR